MEGESNEFCEATRYITTLLRENRELAMNIGLVHLLENWNYFCFTALPAVHAGVAYWVGRHRRKLRHG
ncbi:hypothetical protein TcBrA4_0088370 [Trypanosoma cruzi]|nr:hypothetical protein TcBrA4_0088370 [Trypanosoma cruzi]